MVILWGFAISLADAGDIFDPDLYFGENVEEYGVVFAGLFGFRCNQNNLSLR